MTKKTIELLAPAGNLEAYKAAAAAGADAIYLGAKGFNARQQADNFQDIDLKPVIEDAHVKGIKIYFVLNTLLKDAEIDEACKLASFVYNMGIDAVIVQDPGLAHILKKHVPDLPLHASTQMSIHNTDGVKAAQELGIERVILARELNLKEIKSIVLTTNAEIEVFVHGALCVSRSGQCLLSSFIGGRSGNRGRCAQPCRLPWETNKISEKYLLSPKELMTLDILPELIDTGIAALKIEGRMKSHEYVAAVVSVYRKYLDLAISNPDQYKVDPADIRMLMQVFNRGGFTTGYFKDYTFKSLMSVEHPKHWGLLSGITVTQEGIHQPKYSGNENDRLIRIKLSDEIRMGDGLEIRDSKNNNPSAILSVMMKDGKHVKKASPGDTLLVGNFRSEVTPQSMVYKTYDKALMESLTAISAGSAQRVPLKGEFKLLKHEYPTLDICDLDGNAVHTMGNERVSEASDRPTTDQRVEEQLKKTKDTPYYFEAICVNTDNSSFIPVSEINRMRRVAIDALTSKRRAGIRRPKNSINSNPTYFPGNMKRVSKNKEISLYLHNVPDSLNWASLNVNRLYFPVASLEQVEAAKEFIPEIYIWLPATLNENQMDWAISKLKPINDMFDGILTGNLGGLHRIRADFPKKPIALDFQMNVMNSHSVAAFTEYSPTSITLSLELNLKEIKQVHSPAVPLEVYVYGEIPVMTMEQCPGFSNGGCTRRCLMCNDSKGYLTDRIGKRFWYRTDPMFQRTTIFNSSKLMLEDINPLKETDVSILRIGVMDESPDEITRICEYYRKRWIEDSDGPSFQNVDNLHDYVQGSFTNGHFYRGVE